MIGAIANYGANMYGSGYYASGMSGGQNVAGASNGVNGPEGAGQIGNKANAAVAGRTEKTQQSGECQTCKERKYVDGSDENVSFKSATHIAPGAAMGAVSAHEGEHVTNAYTKAGEKGGQVVNASVTIHMGVCPECGRTYVAGGTTRTTIKYPNESNPYQQARKSQDALKLRGQNINYVA